MTRLRRQIETIENLISDSAHQLRTPIAALRAQAELAEEEDDPARRRDIVARIHRRSIDLSRLTDQILSRALVIHRSDVAIHETIDLRTVAIAASQVFDDGSLFESGRLKLDVPASPVPVRGDALSLQEAAKNFVNNALSHGQGKVTVAVRAAAGQAQLAVSDEGPGPSPDALARLGARFAAGRSGPSGGGGIGLAIAKAVADAHRGEIRAGSAAVGGFEIALILPLAKGADL
jgi:two-component system sensor histidine kinase TctE